MPPGRDIPAGQHHRSDSTATPEAQPARPAAAGPGAVLTASTVMALQRSAGNAAVVARLKDDDERGDDALETMAEVNSLLADEIAKHANYAAAIQCLSLEGLSRGTGRERRSLVRAATLAYLTVGGRPIAEADTIRSKLVKMDKAALRIVLQRWVPDDVLAPQTGRSSFPALGAGAKEKKAWAPENFSDPAAHDKDKPFRYVVVALQNQAKDKNRAYKYTDFLKNPGILQNFMNSTSVIDEEHRGTYTPYGFILRVPAENVEIASTKDIGIANQSGDIERETERAYGRHGLPDPDEMLANMPAPKNPQRLPYNEVVVRGRSGAGTVKVTGFFVKTQKGELARPYDALKDKRAPDAYVSPALMKEIQTAAQALKVPIVFIDEDDPSQDRLEAFDEDKSASAGE